MHPLKSVPGALVMSLVVSTIVFAQNPTGTISGHVVSPDGLPIPNVAVTATSPSLQGARITSTSEGGDYILALLPPGDYTVRFERGDFQSETRMVGVAPIATVALDVTMAVERIAEAVNVIATAEPFIHTAQLATRFKQDLLATLPTARTLLSAVNLAPTTTATGPGGQFSFAGAMTFENKFMLNGVVVQDNIRGTPFNLFIEDAVQELTVATAGVSAEHGRFVGGMVNAVTKSGGNTFSGSFRTSLRNDKWRTTVPFAGGDPKVDKVVPIYEYTIGGPVFRDRLWFFNAGRFEENVTARQTRFTNIPYDFTDDEKRYEGKVTYSFDPSHAIKAAYMNIQRNQNNNSFGTIMDRRSLYDRSLPQDLLSVHYTGILTSNLFLEANLATRDFTFKNSGSRFTDIVNGTLLLDRQRGNARYWSPTFCGVCDDEKRDNENVVVKGSYFLSTPAAGAHNFVFGYDYYNDERFANNHQSGSDWRISGTTSIIRGEGVLPVFEPNSTIIQFNPIDQLSQGSNFRAHALFLNDSWRFNDHFSFSLGLRWDKNDGEDESRQKVTKDSLWSPRLSVIWDPRADGVWNVTGSYGRYVAAIAGGVAGDASPAGVPWTLTWFYQGPSINSDPSAPVLAPDQAIRRLFDWFESDGGQNRPLRSASLSGIDTKILESLKSPHADEAALGVSRRIGARATVRADAVFRDYRDFYATRVDTTTGKVSGPFGRQFDLVLIENTDAVERQYAALALQGTYRASTRLDLGGNYTLSRVWGNIDGETSGSGPVTAAILEYPEYRQARWNTPVGDLASDQRHKVRLWGSYQVPFWEGFGSLNVAVLQQVDSGLSYEAAGLVNPTPYVSTPGYITPPAEVTYFFSGRSAFRTETLYRTDLALNYAYRILAARGAELFFRGDVLNVFDQFALWDITEINTTILTSVNSAAMRPFNPFTETPLKGVHWTEGPSFGKPTRRFAYTTPRTLRFSVGVRF